MAVKSKIAAMVAAAARLPAAERRELMEAIADTLADEACGPLSPELKAELERRVAESDAGIGKTVPWETVLAEALARWPRRRSARGSEGRPLHRPAKTVGSAASRRQD